MNVLFLLITISLICGISSCLSHCCTFSQTRLLFSSGGDCRYHMQAYSDEVFHIKISSRSVSTFNFLDAHFLSDCFQLSLARHVLYFILPSKLKKPKYRIMIFLAFF